MKDYCTLWPDKWWSDCCMVHDASASKLTPWIIQNWYLAQCVYASSYSARCDTKLKKYGTRFVVAPLMFLGTSTFGWFWRVKALL